MDWKMRALIVIGIHVIGAIITLIAWYKDGTFEWHAKNGDGYYWAAPSDVVFHAVVAWEIHLLLYIICTIDELIDDFFYKKYEEDKDEEIAEEFEKN